jgi:nicotinamide-nucleotide amidase
MKIALIAIGNELLNGKIFDKNTHFLARNCFKQGLELTEVRIVGDRPDQLIECFKDLSSKVDHIITTGGLGPTPDDLTKDILAQYFGVAKVHRDDAEDLMNKQLEKYDRPFDKTKSDYANVPLEFDLLSNEKGVAPGLSYKNITALPGVPLEFQWMLLNEVLPKLSPSKDDEHLVIKTYKAPESKIFNSIAPKLWDQLNSYGEVSSLPHALGVDIGIRLENSKRNKKQEIIDLIKATPLADLIWHIGEELLEEVIINEAKAKGLTFGFSESCTGGLNASRITDISGSSAVFWGSIVSYANEVKMNSLDVSDETLKNHGAVSEKTALEMAIGARKNLNVDIAISTTGIAGPGGGSPEKPVGTIGIGISSKHGDSAQMHKFVGDRALLKQRFSQMALFTLLDEIRKF